MRSLNAIVIRFAFVFLCLGASSSSVLADDSGDLKVMLHEFLAGVAEAETHDRFWAHDLIYTSSRGTRTGKAEIMAGLTASSDSETDEPGPVFSAEDIQIQIYGETAIVAFRLVATPAESRERQEYFNTGTFLKRDGLWQAVAWQATVIPETIIPVP